MLTDREIREGLGHRRDRDGACRVRIRTDGDVWRRESSQVTWSYWGTRREAEQYVIESREWWKE